MIYINLLLCVSLSLAIDQLEFAFHDSLQNAINHKADADSELPLHEGKISEIKSQPEEPFNDESDYFTFHLNDELTPNREIRKDILPNSLGQERQLQNGFSKVRSVIPDTIPLDDIYVPMSASTSERWGFLKQQYQLWFSTCAPAKNSNNARGGNSSECWRYDPMKTLYEIARRSQLMDESVPGVLLDAQQTAQEFLKRQDFRGSSGEWPDCASGVSDMPGVDKCDMKYWGHTSAAWVSPLNRECTS
jgi:hypothetical protein